MEPFRKCGKLVSILIIVAIVVSSSIVAVSIFNPTEAQACRDQGCNVFFWKCHTDKWVGYCPSDTLRTLFYRADRYHMGDTNLLNTLSSNWFGSNPADYAAGMLLREGTAARLNVSNPYIDYHYSGYRVITMVNGALASGDFSTMFSVTKSLAKWNNAGNPWGY